MADTPLSPTPSVTLPSWLAQESRPGLVRSILAVLLAAAFALLILAALHQFTNGDEYIFLSSIHQFVSGQRINLTQTAHVYFFYWLPFVGENEIDQIVIARLLYVLIWAVSLVLLFRLGTQLLDPLAALAGVVLFSLFSHSLAYAANFRVDTLLLPFLLSIALLLLNPSTARVAMAGALSGIAVALTVKSVLWAPTFIGVLAVGLWGARERLKPVLAGTAALFITLGAYILVHAWINTTEAGARPEIPAKSLWNLASYMFFNGFLPRWETLRDALILNPATSILILVGLCLAVAELRGPESRSKALLLLLLSLPALSILFYTNAFAYSYIVFIPSACLLAGKAVSTFMARSEPLRLAAAVVCLLTAAGPLAILLWTFRVDQQEHQERVLSEVHQLFKKPVPYIDGSGTVASFPRPIYPITRLAFTSYRAAGEPRFAKYIRQSHPPLLIVNEPSLDVWPGGQAETVDPELRLIPEDEQAIRDTYAHYWDLIYLAGRQWRDVGPGEKRSFDIVVPGNHTLLSKAPITIDGERHAPGATVLLGAGRHELETTAAEPDLRILWGRGLKLRPEISGAAR